MLYLYPPMQKALAILLMLLIGAFCPYFERFQFLIRYFLMSMLFFSFMKVRWSSNLIQRRHFFLIPVMVANALLIYFLLRPFDPLLAQVGFIMCIAPTAIVSPVLADLMRKDVAFVTAAMLVTNLSVALILPVLIPLVSSKEGMAEISSILLTILITIGVPFLLSQLVQRGGGRLYVFFQRLSPFAFFFFLANIFLAAAKASHFIQFESTASWQTMGYIFLVTALVCIYNFTLGHKLGGRALSIETSLSLGRKNTMLSIWLALTFFEPTVVLAPIAYILCQNAYNSWQLYAVERSEVRGPTSGVD